MPVLTGIMRIILSMAGMCAAISFQKPLKRPTSHFMMQHKYPFTMLHFQIDPQTLDVNVHPTKMELRFSDGEFIYDQASERSGECPGTQGTDPGCELKRKRVSGMSRRFEEKKAPRPEPFETKTEGCTGAAGRVALGGKSPRQL